MVIPMPVIITTIGITTMAIMPIGIGMVTDGHSVVASSLKNSWVPLDA